MLDHNSLPEQGPVSAHKITSLAVYPQIENILRKEEATHWDRFVTFRVVDSQARLRKLSLFQRVPEGEVDHTPFQTFQSLLRLVPFVRHVKGNCRKIREVLQSAVQDSLAHSSCLYHSHGRTVPGANIGEWVHPQGGLYQFHAVY